MHEQEVPLRIVSDRPDDGQGGQVGLQPLQNLHLLLDDPPVFPGHGLAVLAHGGNEGALATKLRHEVGQLRHEEDDHQSHAKDGQEDSVVLSQQAIH